MAAESSAAAAHHTVAVSSISFTVETRYTPTRLLGQGGYGVVCAASAAGAAEPVAIKKCAGVFDARRSCVEAARRALREMALMRQLRHDNVLAIRDLMLSPDGADAYLVFECMDSDLGRVIASNEPLSSDHCRWFVYQLLCGIKYLHSASVIHRDLKPSNLLVNTNCDLKISDFGLARPIARPDVAESAEGSGPSAMTQYVVTRWYRAPEILLLVSTYTTAVDLWSAGCILAELLLRRPLFRGASHVGQLQARHVSVGRSLMPRVGRTVPYLIPVCIRRRSSVCSARRRTPTSRISTPS